MFIETGIHTSISRDERSKTLDVLVTIQTEIRFRAEHEYETRYLTGPSKRYPTRVTDESYYTDNGSRSTIRTVMSIAIIIRLARGLSSSSGIASGSYIPERIAPLRQVSVMLATPHPTENRHDSVRAVCPIERLTMSIDRANPD